MCEQLLYSAVPHFSGDNSVISSSRAHAGAQLKPTAPWVLVQKIEDVVNATKSATHAAAQRCAGSCRTQLRATARRMEGYLPALMRPHTASNLIHCAGRQPTVPANFQWSAIAKRIPRRKPNACCSQLEGRKETWQMQPWHFCYCYYDCIVVFWANK